MTSPARPERLALCDLFLDLGPDVPTLIEEWTARDLAGHLVQRERRPDATIGAVVSALASYSEHVRIAETERPWTELVELVRRSPPAWNPMRIPAIDTAANSVEFFVHHEDVRRAQASWTPRVLPADLEDALATSLRRIGRLLTRKAKGIGLVLRPAGRDEIRLRGGGGPVVTIEGSIGEGVLYAFGRKGVAEVSLDGPPEAVARVEAASFGF